MWSQKHANVDQSSRQTFPNQSVKRTQPNIVYIIAQDQSRKKLK